MISQDPFEILGNQMTNMPDTFLGISQNAGIPLTEFVRILISSIPLIAVVTTLLSIGSIMLIRKNEKLLAEKKQDVIDKLKIVLLASVAIDFFNLLKLILDEFFQFIP